MESVLKIKIDSRQANKANDNLKGLERQSANTESRTLSLTKAVTALGVSFLSYGAINKTVSTIGNFQDSINKLGAISGATETQLASLQKQARELGATSIFSATQAADAQTFLAQAGFKTNEILKATPSVMQLAVAGTIDLARAGDLASNVLGGMGLAVSELDNVVDVLAKTASSSNTNIEQLGNALSYAAPIAKTAGISIQELSAAVGVLGDAGLQGSRAGTGILGFIRQLSNVTP
jgi:TP901 family phage tail tape measure protein